MLSDSIKQLKKDLVRGAKAIFSKGLVEVGEGNVSIRIPNTDELLITPTFNRYETMTEEDVVYLKFDGTLLSNRAIPSSEYKLHVCIYEARQRAQCVIHTHSPYATMLSVVRKKIPILLEEMVIFLGGEVNVCEFGQTRSKDIGINALKALGTKNAVLLANHGTLVCARNIDHAIKMAELVEKMALIYWGSLQIGETMVIYDNLQELQKNFNSNFSTL